MGALSGLSGLSGLGGVFGGGAYPFSTSPAYTMRQGLALALIPAWAYQTVAETAGSQGLTLAQTLGSSLVGTVDDYSPSPQFVYATGSGSRPTLVADATLGAAWNFSGSQVLTLPNSQTGPNFIHRTGIFKIMAWVRLTNTTGTKMILDATNDTETTTGLMIRVSGQTITVKLCDGSSPAAAEVSVASYFTAGTWVCVEIVGEGVGANKLKIAKDGGSFTTGTVANTLNTSGDASFAYRFGINANSSTNQLSGDIGPFFIWNRDTTSNERAAFLAWRPGYTTENPYTYAGGALTTASHARNLYVMHDSTYVRTTGDTAVSSDEQVIETVKHAFSSLYAFDPKRDLTVTAASTAPLWRTSAVTGLSVGGVRFNDNIDWTDSLSMGVPMRRSYAMTRVFIVANHKTEVLQTSHVIREQGTGSSYMAVVPDGYQGDSPRWSYHDNNGNGPDGSKTQGVRDHDHFNVIVVTRVGGTYYGYTNGVLTASGSGSTFGVAFDTLGGTNSTPSTSYSPWATWTLCAELPWALSASQIAAMNTYYTSTHGIS